MKSSTESLALILLMCLLPSAMLQCAQHTFPVEAEADTLLPAPPEELNSKWDNTCEQLTIVEQALNYAIDQEPLHLELNAQMTHVLILKREYCLTSREHRI